MAFADAILKVLNATSFFASLIQQWKSLKAKKESQKQRDNINENPYEAFSDEFGSSAGSVRVSSTSKQTGKLPTSGDES